MKRFFVAILLSALALFSISGAAYARVNLRVCEVSDPPQRACKLIHPSKKVNN